MSLNIEMRFDENENRWIFLPEGELDIYTSPKFKEEVLKSLDIKQTDILIDGEKLTYVDSTGLGALISILKKLKDNDYKIYLSNIKPNIRKIFSITELDKLFIIRGELNE
ncbi:STAS domain-containing protein [Tissierella sp.]|uniref:STAS domain-containing protein n=1 Tax=Tissierella sp. TaxID=41274 RepID=UPI002867147C|nr:STAS domain-containing protein [Tissierella sp.]MDR7854956.1 STAS domain-containing protein [Tissierella sp.]